MLLGPAVLSRAMRKPMVNKPIPLFPTILMPPEEHEHLIGYVWRNSVTSSRRRMKGQVDALLDRQALQPPWIVPCNLQKLSVSLRGVLGSADHMLRNHTCLPALLPFVRSESIQQVMGHVLRGDSHCGIPSMLGLASRYIKSKPVLALCTECVREDEARLGFTYWRRFHALPGVTYCVSHLRNLVHGCGACAYSSPKCRAPRLPQLRCWCGRPHARLPMTKSPADREHLMKLSRSANELLLGALEGHTSSEIGAYYFSQAREAGYASGSRLHTPALVRAFQRRYSEELLSQLNASIGVGRTNWLEAAMGSRMAPLALTRNLLLLDFFGSRFPKIEDFKRAEADATAVQATRALKAQKPSVALDNVRTAREQLERFLRANPTASRQEVIRSHGFSVSIVRALDREWYDSRLPSRRGGNTLSLQKRAAYGVEFDARTSQHVWSQSERLLRGSGRPRRLTRSALLLGCPRANEVTKAREKSMPQTARALAACVESPLEYKERYAVYVLKTAAPNLDRYQEARRRTGLAISRIMQLAAEHIILDLV